MAENTTTNAKPVAKRAAKKRPATKPTSTIQTQTRTLDEIADDLEARGRELLLAASIARGEKVDRRKKEFRSAR